MTARKSTKD